MGVLRENKEKLLTVLEVDFYIKTFTVIMIFYSVREERKQNMHKKERKNHQVHVNLFEKRG